MRQSSELENLVGSLGKGEKKHFRLSLPAKKSGRDYVALFDALEKKKRGYEARQDTRRYLFQHIMKGLCEMQAERSVDARLFQLLTGADVLYGKGLMKARKKMLEQARALATLHEKFELLLEITRQERIGIHDPLLSGKILAEQQEYITRIQHINEYKHLSAKISALYTSSGEIRTKKQQRQYEKLLAHPLLKNRKAAVSTEEKYFYCSILFVYYALVENNRKALALNTELIRHLEERPQLLEQKLWQKRYVVILDNHFLGANAAGNTKLAEEILNKLKLQPGYLGSFSLHYVNLLGTIIRSGNFSSAQQHLNDIELLVRRPGAEIHEPSKAAFFMNVSCAYFCMGNYPKALEWLNRILNDPQLYTREDIPGIAKIYNLILHFELKNFDYLDHLVRSAYRYLKKKNRLFRFEAAFLDFIQKRIPPSGRNSELLLAFRELKTTLEKVMKDPYEQRVLEYFDFIAWLQSKTEARPLPDVIKERNQQELKKKKKTR